MSYDLEKLRKHRDALLLASTGALLHNLGKVSSRFLTNSLHQNYLFQHFLGLVGLHTQDPSVRADVSFWKIDWNQLSASRVLDALTEHALTNPKIVLDFPFDDRTYVSGDLIEYLGVGEPWYKPQSVGNVSKYGIEFIFPEGSRLTHLMNRAHRGASGGEKQDIATKQQEDVCDLYRATPFGWEVQAPNKKNIDDLKKEVELVIHKYLLPVATPFPYDNMASELRPLLEQAIADTRRPLNDVTVWDIGHTGAAFLVTQVVGLMWQQRSVDHEDLTQTENNNLLYWRVLTLRTNGLWYLGKASSMADVRARYRLLQESLRQTRRFLEGIPAAIEVYRDENGSAYIVPDLDANSAFYQEIYETLLPLSEIDGVRLSVTLSPKLLVSHPKDKGGDYVGTYILDTVQEPPSVPEFAARQIATAWFTSQNGKEICVACGIRKAESQSLCRFCMARRVRVSKDWAISGLNKTVWTDEVADNNGRVALVAGRWDVEKFAQAIIYPKNKDHQNKQFDDPTPWIRIENLTGRNLPQQITIGRSPQTQWQWYPDTGMYKGEKGVACPSRFMRGDFPSLKIEVCDIYRDEEEYVIVLTQPHTKSGIVSLVGVNFEVIDANKLRTTDEGSRRKIETLFLYESCFTVEQCIEVHDMVQNPSFARIRRVWETTQRFWRDVLPTDKTEVATDKTENTTDETEVATDETEVATDSLAAKIIGSAGPRLKIQGITYDENGNPATPTSYQSYDLVLPGSVKLSVVWDGSRFITCDNLAYAAKLSGKKPPKRKDGEKDTDYIRRLHEWSADEMQQAIENGTLAIEEPVGYGGKNKAWGKIDINSVRPLPDRYTPAIPILAEPRTFMALVPADKALDVVQAIKQKYETEMGKVRNRLPLHLGIVYAGRRTPLRAVLDAGRRMLRQKSLGQERAWQVTEDVLLQQGDLPEAAKELADGTQQFAQWYAVKLKQDDRQLTWYVPAVMGDGDTLDAWYPYVFVQADKNGKLPAGRKHVFRGLRPTESGTEECWLVHAGELKEGDTLYFTPATLDWVWLDSSARRFEVAYDEHGHRRGHLTRPYLLDELEVLDEIWQALSSSLTSTQIHALREFIEGKREGWHTGDKPVDENDPVFRQFCRDALANSNWKGKPWDDDRRTWLDRWAGYAARGWLSDVIELQMQILKQKPETEKEAKQ